MTPEQPDASTTPDGERKTVTALFADIKGSTELMEDIDPEEARSIVDPALKLMIDAAHRYDGYIVQSTGDGIFALFGAPVAHEDHPQRALYAALRLQEDLKRYSAKVLAEGGTPIQGRVGVNTGEVVVRSIQTGAGQTEYTPIGHTTNLASRMQTAAPVGSIAVSENTRRLCEGYFILKPLGATRVKGVSEPVNVYEVTGLGPLRTRLQRAVGRGLTKFVGREHEMEALRLAAEQVKSGRGQIVAAMAEPGVGKSRLYFEFKATSQSGWMVLETFSVSHGKASAYLPIIDLLRNYFRIASEDDERTRREKVTGRVLALDRSLEDTLPYLFALLSIVEGDDPLAQMDGQIKKRRTLEAIKRIALRESLNQPLMVIFEDLHWIDEQTEEFLNLLADSIGTAKILLLANYRPEYSHQWGSKTYYTQLRLDPLGKESADEMLSALLGASPAPAKQPPGASRERPSDDLQVAGRVRAQSSIEGLKRLIIERTEGNPFFMEETVQILFDEGALARNGTVHLTKPLAELKIPPTVQAILASRIDRLPSDEKELLQTLSVIGREFVVSLVRRVFNGRKNDELERMLTNMQMAEFIYEQPATGDIGYTFKHALTQEVAYNSVLAERRRMIHEQTARSIERLYEQQLEDHWSELTYHYLRGIDAAKAVHYSRLAADQANMRSAYPEAASITEAALKVLQKIPDSTERIRAELALRNIEWGMTFIRYGPSSQERERIALRMCELGEEIGGDELLRGHTAVAGLYFGRGEPARGLAPARRCLQLAKATQDPGLLTRVNATAGLLAWSCGNFREAVYHFDEAVRQSGRTDARFFVGFSGFYFRGAARSELALSMQLLGRVGEAGKLAEEALRRARESGHLHSLSHALGVAGQLLRCYRREAEIVRGHASEAIALAEENGFAFWLPWGHLLHGWALAELGQPAQGVAEMEDAIASVSPWQQYANALLAQGYAKMGRTDEALATLNQAVARLENTGERMGQAEILRLKGEVLQMRDSVATAEAEHCFRAALEVARQQEARWWELRTTVSLARLLRDTNRRDEARTVLAEIYNWFTEGFHLPDLLEAKSLLKELAAV